MSKNSTTLAKADTYKPTDVKRHDGPLLIPTTMTPVQAHKMLGDYIAAQEEVTNINREFECLPQDGAAALNAVMTEIFGWTAGLPTPSFFGENPPEIIRINTDVDTTISVPWGRMDLPNLHKGFVETGLHMCDKTQIGKFKLTASCRRKDEPWIIDLFDKVEKEIRGNSVFRGKAFSISFSDDGGAVSHFPAIDFIDVSSYTKEGLILPEMVRSALEIALWVPIEKYKEVKAEFGSVKRGVLMEGPYGTGKTLAISVTAALAKKAGFTVVYAKKATEIAKVMAISAMYQSPVSVMIIEDIDAMLKLEQGTSRSDKFNNIINTVDGIDTKSNQVITMFTTNHIEAIEPSALRQGRISAKIQFQQPDAGAAEALIRLYAKDKVKKDLDLKEVGEILEGMNPAEIEEVVTMAKYAQILENGKCENLSSDSLVKAAGYMRMQADRQRELEHKAEAVRQKPEKLDQSLNNTLEPAFKDMGSDIVEQISKLIN